MDRDPYYDNRPDHMSPSPMRQIDHLPPDVRAVVHEYGWEFVSQMLKLGCKGARQMRHIAYSLNAGRGAGGEIRERPHEAESAEIERLVGTHRGAHRNNHQLAFDIAHRMFSGFHWGRCKCIK